VVRRGKPVLSVVLRVSANGLAGIDCAEGDPLNFFRRRDEYGGD
jgi:hypothetical protein